MPWPDGVAAVSTRILQVGAHGHHPLQSIRWHDRHRTPSGMCEALQ